MPKKHHLFAVTHRLLKAATALTVAGIAILALASGALLVATTYLDGHGLGIPNSVDGVPRIDALAIGAAAVVSTLICLALVFFALRATAGIVESAISGDPFVTENARRMVHIGWFLLAAQIVGILGHRTFDVLVAHFVPEQFRGDVNFNFGFDFSPIGLLAVLLIFVLAQIFRHGSEMRAELEATV